MDPVDNTTLIAIIAGTVGVAQVLARVLEKLVSGLLEQLKKKNGKGSSTKEKAGVTTDLALQGQTLESLGKELDETKRVVYDVKAMATKLVEQHEHPNKTGFGTERIEGLYTDGHKEVLSELRELRRAIDNNSAATKALHNFLARSS